MSNHDGQLFPHAPACHVGHTAPFAIIPRPRIKRMVLAAPAGSCEDGLGEHAEGHAYEDGRKPGLDVMGGQAMRNEAPT